MTDPDMECRCGRKLTPWGDDSAVSIMVCAGCERFPVQCTCEAAQ